MPQTKLSTNAALLEEIRLLRADVQALKAERTPVKEPDPIPRRPLWTLIREYLDSVGGSAEPKEIADALLAVGNNIGKYPLRSVKICVTSPHVASVFSLSTNATGQETVHLRGKAIPFRAWSGSRRKSS